MDNNSLTDANHHPQMLYINCPNWQLIYPLHGIYKKNWFVVGTVNLIIAPVVFIINLVTLIALRKARDRDTITNYIFTSLCTADMLTGLFAQLLYGTFHVNVFHNKSFCPLLFATSGSGYFFITISFFTLFAIRVERYIGVFRPLHYEKIALDDILIKKIIVITWLATAVFILICFFTPHMIMYKIFVAIVVPIAFIWSCYVQLKIVAQVYKITRSLCKATPERDEIEPCGERYIKRVRCRINKIAGLILVAYIICYTPSLIMYILLSLDYKSKIFLALTVWTETIAFTNSIFNPLLFCLQKKDVRQTVAGILRAVFCCNYQKTEETSACTGPQLNRVIQEGSK